MNQKIYVIYLETEGRFEDRETRLVVAQYDESCKVAAEAEADKHDQVTVIYGQKCEVVKKHTEIMLPTM